MECTSQHFGAGVWFKFHLPLHVELSKAMKVEDTAVPGLLNLGMPIVGEALVSPYFDACDRVADISVQELLITAPKRRAAIIEEVLKNGRASESCVRAAIWNASIKRVAKGSARGPFAEEQITSEFGHLWNAVPTFAVEQGLNSNGSCKFRKIANHKRARNNAAHRRSRP